jgi:glutamin-(asparagin-)ase
MPPLIALVGTGGSIAGRAPEGASALSAAYRSAVVSAADLAAAVPGLDQLARVQTEQLFQIDSADFTDDKLLTLARRVAALCARADVAGVVITHGTDTLEESAYFLHLTVRSSKPIVVIGAMRPAGALAADGPANLLHAVAVAAHPTSAGRGVLVVMNQEIHSARDVTKTHSLRLDAFASQHGALGLVVEGAPRWYRALTRPHTVHSEFDIASIDSLPLVGLVASPGDMRREIYAAWVALGARAIVHAGFGGGTVPEYLKPMVSELCARGVCLVRCSRVGAGPLIRKSNFDDEGVGTVVADDQNPPRARLLAALALTRTRQAREVQRFFDGY